MRCAELARLVAAQPAVTLFRLAPSRSARTRSSFTRRAASMRSVSPSRKLSLKSCSERQAR